MQLIIHLVRPHVSASLVSRVAEISIDLDSLTMFNCLWYGIASGDDLMLHVLRVTNRSTKRFDPGVSGFVRL
jgi:hypothetical protein